MLWVYINNTGTIECQVNVGNKIRQGDGFQCFIVPWNMNGENSVGSDVSEFSTLVVNYLCPPNMDFRVADESPNPMTKTFHLKAPSQVNSYFKDNVVYNGFVANIPHEATDFAVNGGNIALEFKWVTNEGGDTPYTHTQNLTIYVEPTYGAKKTLIAEDNYSYILNMLKQANFILAFPMTIATANGASAIPDDDAAFPTIMLSKSFGFVKGTLAVDRTAMEGDMDGFATIAYLDNANVTLRMVATLFGRDQEGNDVQLRLNDGGNGRINLDLYVDDISEETEHDTIDFFGTCWVDAEFLEFGDADNSGKLITDVQCTYSSGSEPSATCNLVSHSDGSATLVFNFVLAKGDTGADGVGIASIEQVREVDGSGQTNIWQMTLTDGRTSDFRVKNGIDGTNGLNGANGAKFNEVDVVGPTNLLDTFYAVGPSKVFAVGITISNPPNTTKELCDFYVYYTSGIPTSVAVFDHTGTQITDAGMTYTVYYYTDADPMVLDSSLNPSSTNAVENQAVANGINLVCLDWLSQTFANLNDLLASAALEFHQSANSTQILSAVSGNVYRIIRASNVGSGIQKMQFFGYSSGFAVATMSGGAVQSVAITHEAIDLGVWSDLPSLLTRIGIDSYTAEKTLVAYIASPSNRIEARRISSDTVYVIQNGWPTFYKYDGISWKDYMVTGNSFARSLREAITEQGYNWTAFRDIIEAGIGMSGENTMASFFYNSAGVERCNLTVSIDYASDTISFYKPNGALLVAITENYYDGNDGNFMTDAVSAQIFMIERI